jgi:hypothetical protein
MPPHSEFVLISSDVDAIPAGHHVFERSRLSLREEAFSIHG